MQLSDAALHPCDVVLDTALPAVLEGPYLCFVAPNYLVDPIREERRVKIDQVNRLRRKLG